jgi:hypothetical protein
MVLGDDHNSLHNKNSDSHIGNNDFLEIKLANSTLKSYRAGNNNELGLSAGWQVGPNHRR